MPLARQTAALALCLGLMGAPLAAQDRLDGFAGTVDGEARDWHVLVLDGEASGKFHDFGGMLQVEVFGFPRADSVSDIAGALEIGMTLMGADPHLADATLVYFREGVGTLFVPEDDADIQVTLTEARVEGEALHLAGRLEAEVFRMVRLATEELDLDDGHRVTAEFDLTLPLR